jgi:bifunctional non-homologous end joining protein LigD
MPLKTYRMKRKFNETSEPKGRVWRFGRERIFVVQKHDASHLHYDFRLEIGGVLVSWVVPKGPTLDPSRKRFATMTEDHPIEYADFEGTIPEGHYGAGTVMIWDKGTFETEDGAAPEDQLGNGELKIELQGKKLRGAFVLVHMGHRSGTPQEKSRKLGDIAGSVGHKEAHIEFTLVSANLHRCSDHVERTQRAASSLHI